ncbi:DNA-directed RNA polymerases I and III subunit RPAC1 [Thelohanellus kitauei]|uniref:DNA-directed RNA polymerases I and III subunit RPAC1 n=1 Tax=Thelohanellus kitauei TaxID=669202 RepID=A0A0C2NBX6_THEKT|nr:DNA-directed RNA polymerases I and III subunit RPAC1 [Thelohanellus kitauei]
MAAVELLGQHKTDKVLNETVHDIGPPEIIVRELTKDDLKFEVKNIHTSFANALRRILISEVPTMAIEKVLMEQNTSVIADEILSSRLGLTPIYCNPTCLKYHQIDPLDEDPESVLVFELRVRGKSAQTYEDDLTIVNVNVYSEYLKWVPIGNQEQLFGNDPPRVALPKILLAKLAPGEEIILRAICHKGIGQDHAKFSPVATASYRMMPHISLKKPILNELAQKLQTYFSPGVISLVTRKDGNIEAQVNPSQIDAMSLNAKHDPVLGKLVEITRIPNHFIFNVESTGIIPPNILVKSAVEILIAKCQKYLDETKHL